MHEAADELTIVLPAWNEEAVIAGTLREVLAAPGLEDVAVLVVDDGSTDRTADVVLEMGRMQPRLRVETVPHGGKDLALWHAIRTSATPWMGLMDADGQYDPADFPRLLATARERSVDAVWGQRAQRSDHPWRLLCSRVARAVKRATFGALRVDDPGCGIWVARVDFLRPVAEGERAPAGQLHCHLAELIAAQGGRVGQMAIHHRHRAGGQAKYNMLNRLGPGSRSLAQAGRLARRLAVVEKPS
jgi:dolichol-phosphate mannosyltransferase